LIGFANIKNNRYLSFPKSYKKYSDAILSL
jgi:hypothetical protein